jgi:hypothetical protein
VYDIERRDIGKECRDLEVLWNFRCGFGEEVLPTGLLTGSNGFQ